MQEIILPKHQKHWYLRGKAQNCRGVKIRKYLDIENANTGGKDLYDKYILTIGKIIAPKKSQAVKCAKKKDIHCEENNSKKRTTFLA